VSGKRPALEALSAAEKAAVLDELLAARPDLREPAEAHAAQLMTDADRVAVADDVESALQGRDIEELNTRPAIGRAEATSIRLKPPTRSWTRPCSPSSTTFAAGLALACDPQPPNLRRASCSACTNCRHGTSETLLEYAPDYAAERASGVVRDCARLGIELPAVELLDLMPEWSALLR